MDYVRLDEAESRPFLKRALDCGITFCDTPDMYSRGVSEEAPHCILGHH
jgi:1-deoxyxylulose-5-phosphate synthase